MERKTLLFALIVVVLWASTYVGIRVGVQYYSPEHVALIRYVTASFVLLIYALYVRMPLPKKNDLLGIAFTGFIGITLYNIVLNYAESHISAGAASFVVAAGPIFVALFARIFLKEMMTMIGWLGILISIFGVGLISFSSTESFQFDQSGLIILAAPIVISLYFVLQKPYLRKYTVMQYTCYSFWCGTIFLLPFSGGVLQQIQYAPTDITIAVLYLGIIPSALGYAMWSYVLSRVEATKASPFLFLQPIAALPIAWLWISEHPTVYTIIGGILTLTGVLIVHKKGKNIEVTKTTNLN